MFAALTMASTSRRGDISLVTKSGSSSRPKPVLSSLGVSRVRNPPALTFGLCPDLAGFAEASLERESSFCGDGRSMAPLVCAAEG